MSESNHKSRYTLFYSWITNPSKFFCDITVKFNSLTKTKRIFALLLSYLLPLTFGIFIFLFLTQAPAIIIVSSILSPPLILIIGIAFSVIVGGIILLINPGMWSRRYFNKKIDFKAETKRGKKFKRVKGKILNSTTLFRRNLLMLPLVTVFAAVIIGLTDRTWNIYYLGFYFMLVLLTALIWMTIFSGCAAVSMDIVFKGSIRRRYMKIESAKLENIEVNKKQYIIQAIIALGIGIILYILFDLFLGLWIGAPNMPLWNKIAMVFLHGQ